MRVCIHRGGHEIGGTCVEVEHASARLILDVGLPLDAEMGGQSLLPPVRGLENGDPSILGVILTHGHPDHYGLVGRAHPSVPRYLGEATQRILREALFFTAAGLNIPSAEYLVDRQSFSLGPFTVTPYLVDHSAFDAYALLVEAGGQRLFYSGDFRGHGRKGALFERLLVNPPCDIDVLLLEGTNVQPTNALAGLTETDVEEGCVEVCRTTKGMVLACYSPQNVDRLVSLFRAARRSGRTLVMDLYAATIARATGRASIPQADWEGVRVFVPLSQRVKVKVAREFERVDWVRKQRIFPEQLCVNPEKFVMTFRPSMVPDLERANCLDGAGVVWSMWQGYLQNDNGSRFTRWLAERAVPLTILHSSGHSSVADLQRLAAAICAREVVPVHTREPFRYRELFANVRPRQNGEWCRV
jgi:ribonuclease J